MHVNYVLYNEKLTSTEILTDNVAVRKQYIFSDISHQGASVFMVSQKAFFYPSSVSTVVVEVKSSTFPGFRSGFVNTVALTNSDTSCISFLKICVKTRD